MAVALTLNTLAPVLAYAHLQLNADGAFIQICSAGSSGHRVDVDQRPYPVPGKQHVAHCPYCAGFAAGAGLIPGPVQPFAPVRAAASPITLQAQPTVVGASIRTAQPRGPPYA